MMVELAKTALVPGSIGFLSVGLAGGVVLLYAGANAARWGRRALTALVVIYALLAMPAVSNMLVQVLQAADPPLVRSSDAKGATVVVVIGAGVVSYEADGKTIHQLARRTTFALLEAVRVHKLIGASWVIASGGVADPLAQSEPESIAIGDHLVSLGIPRDQILHESHSRNTAEQLANVTQLVRERKLPEPVILAVVPAQSRRAMLLARKHNLEAIPSIAARLRYDHGQAGWRQWRPNVDALRGSEAAMYEYLALARAWLQPPTAPTRAPGRHKSLDRQTSAVKGQTLRTLGW